MARKWELEEVEDDGEALSLSDLPIHQCANKDKQEPAGSSSDYYKFGKESDGENREDFDFCIVPEEMCAADEVFFQGQILPLPLQRGVNLYPDYTTRPLSRSGSMPGGFNSSRSTSSGSGSGTTHRNINGRKSSSSAWNILKLGLVSAPPDVKTRWSSGTYKTSGGGKKKPVKNNGNNVVLSGCNCSSSTVAVDGVIVRRSAPPRTTRKRQLSRSRTFEWLKQLSIEGPAPPAIGAVGSN